MDTAERLGETIFTGDAFTFDAGNDKKAAGTDADGRYYVAIATSPMDMLDEDEESDWGTLPEGKKVVEAIYCNLVNKPGYSQARWYTPSDPPIKVKVLKVPVELILHASFEMERATAERPTPMQRSAIAKLRVRACARRGRPSTEHGCACMGLSALAAVGPSWWSICGL